MEASQIDTTPLVNAVRQLLLEKEVVAYDVGASLWHAYPTLQPAILWHLTELEKQRVFNEYLDTLAKGTDHPIRDLFEMDRKAGQAQTLVECAQECCETLCHSTQFEASQHQTSVPLPNGQSLDVGLNVERLDRVIDRVYGHDKDYGRYLRGEIDTFSAHAQLNALCDIDGVWYYLQLPHPTRYAQLDRCIRNHFRRLAVGQGQLTIIAHYASEKSFLEAVHYCQIEPNTALSINEVRELKELGFGR